MKLDDFIPRPAIRYFSEDKRSEYLAPGYPSADTPYHFQDNISYACKFFNDIDRSVVEPLLVHLR